jgi:hypothetical protein
MKAPMKPAAMLIGLRVLVAETLLVAMEAAQGMKIQLWKRTE